MPHPPVNVLFTPDRSGRSYPAPGLVLGVLTVAGLLMAVVSWLVTGWLSGAL